MVHVMPSYKRYINLKMEYYIAPAYACEKYIGNDIAICNVKITLVI